MTLADLVDQWVETRRDIRQVSVDGYRTLLAPIVARHGERRVQSITRPEVEHWVGEWSTTGGARGQGLSHRSFTYALQALKLVFTYAVSRGVIARSPVAEVKAPRRTAADHQEVVVWTLSQLRDFIRLSDTDQLAAAWRLTACGMRRSEVLGLDWEAVDLDAGTVKVVAGRVYSRVAHTMTMDEPKSAASRRAVAVESLQPGTAKLLREEWLRQGRPSSGLVVVDRIVLDSRFIRTRSRAGSISSASRQISPSFGCTLCGTASLPRSTRLANRQRRWLASSGTVWLFTSATT